MALAIAEHLVPSALASGEVAVIANAAGQGLVVYEHRPRPADADPVVAWVAVEGRAFTLNVATQRLTPTLPLVTEASADFWRKSGLNPTSSEEDVRTMVLEGGRGTLGVYRVAK